MYGLSLQRGFTPVLEIDVDGKPVSGVFFSVLISARFRDEEGETTDTISLRLDDRANAIELPRKGAEIAARLGYKERLPLRDKGKFKVQNIHLEGGDGGEFLLIEGKAADLRKSAKAEGKKHYEGKTFGEIVRAEAKAMGLPAVISPALDGLKFDYQLRWNQSHMDFVTRLANEVGGIVKPAGGKLIVQERGSGKSASGQPLDVIRIAKADCVSWRIDPEGRMQYGSVNATWTDPKTGKRKTEKMDTGLEGPALTLKDEYPDQARAKKAAEAEKGRLNRATGSGSFSLYGRPECKAGAPVEAVDFRPGIRGEWRATTVEDIFEAGGYTTEVTVKGKDDGKKGKDD